MDGTHGEITSLWPLVLSSITLFLLAGYGWHRRQVPGALAFALTTFFAMLWVAGEAFELAAIDDEVRDFWARFQAIWILPSVTSNFCFALEYAGLGHRLSRRHVALLCIPPLGFAALFALGLIDPSQAGGVAPGTAAIAPAPLLYWLGIAYAYLLSLTTLGVLVWFFVRSPAQRWPTALVLCGVLVIRIAYPLDVFAAPPGPPIDLMVLATAFASVMYAIALFYFRMFNPLTVGREAAIEQMREGMVVVDSAGQIVDLNRAAETILGSNPTMAKGQRLETALPQVAQSLATLLSDQTTQFEFSLKGQPEPRFYSVSASPLRDHSDRPLGQLLLLHETTEDNRRQAQLLEQQRALATLQERERLARELHDTAGQVLGYVSMQAQSISKRMHDGDLDVAEAQLVRLAGAAREAHDDIRESILSLKSVSADSWTFFAALRQYLTVFGQNYGIRTDIDIAADLDEADFSPATAVQLLRVIQEALTNTRKHSGAAWVQVCAGRRDGLAQIIIKDDGRGFDINTTANDLAGHFGLEFMSERMAEVGGRLELSSQPGTGTRVTLWAPLNGEKTIIGKDVHERAAG